MNRILLLLPLIFVLLISNTADAKKKKYPNGDYYEGEWKKGLPNGYGKMMYANGNTYEGQWILGQFVGTGKMVYSNNNVYQGEWKENLYNGAGIMKYASGNIYDGNWNMGEASGRGKFMDRQNNTFEGTFERGVPTVGRLVYDNGDFCEGIFKSSNIENLRYLSDSCSIYYGSCDKHFTEYDEYFIGKISDGKYDEGKLIQADGGWFEGKWEDDEFYTGKCDGYIGANYYKGNWEEGYFTGQCKLKFIGKDVLAFEGIIIDDKVTEGRIEYKDNCVYEGTLKASSDYLRGRITDYVPSGKGRFSISAKNKKYSFNCIIDGIWNDGKITQLKTNKVLINNTVYSIVLNNQIISIPYKSEIYPTIAISNCYSDISKALNREIGKICNTIILKQPGTILSYLPLEQLDTVEEIVIIGCLDETDLAAINKCKRLKCIDLSRANMQLSPDEIKERETDEAARNQILDFVGLGVLVNTHAKNESNEYCMIPNNTFSNLTSLKELKFPNNVKSISFGVCKNCISLTTVELPSHLEIIGEDAFANCISLREIKFPASLKYLGNGGNYGQKCAFYGCSSLKRVDLSQCTFNDNEWRCNFAGCYSLKELRLPKGITTIMYAPQNKEMNIYIPSNVKSIRNTFDKMTLHFESRIAPIARVLDHVYYPRNCIIYIPKGCITSYYSSFGEQNIYKEM